MSRFQPSSLHRSFAVLDFSKGVNTKYAKTQLREGELADALNVHLEGRGGAKKRGGYQPHVPGDTATGNPIVGLYQLRRPTGNELVRVQNAKIEKADASSWTDITGAATISTDQDARWVFDTFQDQFMGVNGVDVPLKWDGDAASVSPITVTVTNGSDIDTAATVIMHRERMVLGDVTQGGTRFPSRLLPSTALSLDTWDQNDDISLDEGDGDSITAFAESRGYLIVFKQHSLWRITSLGVSGEQTVERIASVGTPGPHTVSVVGTVVFFIDAVGRLWAYDPIGQNEDSLIEVSKDKLGDFTLRNFKKDRLRYAHLLEHPALSEVYSFVTDGLSQTETNRAWVYNTTTGGFSPMKWADNWNVVTRVIDEDGEPIMVGGSYGGLVADLHQGTSDNGQDIESFIVPPPHHVGAMDAIKGLRNIDLYFSVDEAQEIEFFYRKDFNPTGTAQLRQVNTSGDKLGVDFILGESRFATRGEVIDSFRLDGYPRWAQFKFRQVNQKAITYLGYLIYYTIAGERR